LRLLYVRSWRSDCWTGGSHMAQCETACSSWYWSNVYLSDTISNHRFHSLAQVVMNTIESQSHSSSRNE
jgi:hypothetical protein